MHRPDTRAPATVRLPIQARPVVRDDPAGPTPYGATSDGVTASAANCSRLRGVARDMCYSATYQRW